MSKQPSIARSQKPCYDGTCHDRGEVTERLKVLASKASVRETVPWVRIPPSPPFFRVCFHLVRLSDWDLYLFCTRHF
jgi:hypothetical protein